MSKSSSPLINLQNVDLTYSESGKPLGILQDVNLQVDEGESVALTGPSGSGKSSLMMLIAGLEKATRGHIIVAGQNLNDQSEDELAKFRRNHIGLIFQAFHLIPTMTALENVAMPLDLAGRPHGLEQAREELSKVGLENRLHHLPSELSGGEQQRVAIARALIHQPRVILADEPTGNLDPLTGSTIADLLFHLHQELGSTLILITHDLDLAARCQTQYALKQGQLWPQKAKRT